MAILIQKMDHMVQWNNLLVSLPFSDFRRKLLNLYVYSSAMLSANDALALTFAPVASVLSLMEPRLFAIAVSVQ